MIQKIFIGGPARSGTTLLNYLMEGFPKTKILDHELEFIENPEHKKTWHDFCQDPKFDTFVVKSPVEFSRGCNLLIIVCEGYKVIQIMRDGRDCLVSKKNDKYWWMGIDKWNIAAENFLKIEKEPNVFSIYYEDLAEQPTKVINQIGNFIGKKFDGNWDRIYKGLSKERIVQLDNRARPISADRIGNWHKNEHKERLKKELKKSRKETYKFASLLILLDYEQNDEWLGEIFDV